MLRRTGLFNCALVALTVAGGIGVAMRSIAQVPMRTWSLDVRVSERKPTGETWDPMGGAPDIATCAASSAGAGCTMVQGSVARCQDSFACSFTVSLPPSFTLGVWDLDLAQNDLIGTCYIDRPGDYQCGAAHVSAR